MQTQTVKKIKLSKVIDRLNEYWNSPMYKDLNNEIGSMNYAKQSKSGEEITDEMLDHLYRWVLVGKGLRMHGVSDYGEYQCWKEWFDEKMWPLLRERARKLPGLYHFYLEVAVYSDAVIMFDYDAWTDNLATACLLAHGITHDIDGNLMPVEENDPMSTYIRENASLQFMRYRSEKAQEEILRLKKCHPDRKIRVGVFGGGAEPALWLNDLDLSELDVIIYDTNPVMKGMLEQILEQPLESLGVDYRIVNFMEAFEDTSLFDTFDIIIYNGVMSYYPELKLEIMEGTRKLLNVGGVMFFDDILRHPDMIFAVAVRGWTVKLVPEESLEVAIKKDTEFLAKAGLSYDHYLCQEVRGIPNVLVNYAVKTAA